MTGQAPAREDISLFTLGTIVVRSRWRIARWVVLGGVLAALTVISKRPQYRASASFVSQGTDASRSGLASLAGQFGVTIPINNNLSLTPDFYSTLVKSRELLQHVARDTFVVAEDNGRRVPFVELFHIAGESDVARQEMAVKVLMTIVSTSVARPTGIVTVSAATEWPSVSLSIVKMLIDGVNEFNQHTRQEQATSERKFVEGRLNIAGTDLRASEDRLQRFTQTNRQWAQSADLAFEHDRLQRDMLLQQQVFNSLTQSYEEVRIREVRDTPVITMVESPAVPSIAEPRGRVIRTLLGLMLGAVAGAVVVIFAGLTKQQTRQGDPDATEFVGALTEWKDGLLRPVSWMWRRRT